MLISELQELLDDTKRALGDVEVRKLEGSGWLAPEGHPLYRVEIGVDPITKKKVVIVI